MQDIIQLQSIIKNKKEEKKNVLIRLMFKKSFGHLFS